MESVSNIMTVGELGSGNFGTVFRAVCPDTGKRFALKFQEVTPEYMNKLELDIHFRGDPRFIAKAYFTAYMDGYFYILLDEFAGDLTRFPPDASPDLISYATHQMGRAISYIHDMDILHKDIKPENFLLTNDYQVRLTDFGVSAKMGPQAEIAGTPMYMSLEALRGRACNKSDWYGFGLCIYYLVTKKHLIYVKTIREAKASLFKNEVQQELRKLQPRYMRNYISLFVRNNPQDRFTYTGSLLHLPEPMTKTLDWDHREFLNNTNIAELRPRNIKELKPEKMLNKKFANNEYFRCAEMNAALFRKKVNGRFVQEDTIPMYHPSPKSTNFRKFIPVREASGYGLRRRKV